LAGGQGHLFAGVHLPDLMRPRGAARVGNRPPSRRRRGEFGPAQPALERAFGRQEDGGELMAQHHADQSRAPSRMRAAEVQDRLDERLGGRVRVGPTAVIGGIQGGLAPLPQPRDQTTNRTRIEGEFGGDGGRILIVADATPDGLTDGDRKRARHGTSSLSHSGQGLSRSV
jgi:hypothetical protein